MSENFNTSLISNSKLFNNLMTPELSAQLNVAKNMYLQIQPNIEVFKSKLYQRRTADNQNDVLVMETFVDVVKSIPISSLNETQILALFYNYNVDEEYVDKLRKAIYNVFGVNNIVDVLNLQ